MDTHEDQVQILFDQACQVLKLKGFVCRPMRAQSKVLENNKRFSLGRTRLADKEIFIDIYTPRLRKPKSPNGILRIMAHELAHHQKTPYKQWYKGHWIVRAHYPRFYKQVNKNVEKFKKDEVLGRYFG